MFVLLKKATITQTLKLEHSLPRFYQGTSFSLDMYNTGYLKSAEGQSNIQNFPWALSREAWQCCAFNPVPKQAAKAGKEELRWHLAGRSWRRGQTVPPGWCWRFCPSLPAGPGTAGPGGCGPALSPSQCRWPCKTKKNQIWVCLSGAWSTQWLRKRNYTHKTQS